MCHGMVSMGIDILHLATWVVRPKEMGALVMGIYLKNKA